MSIVCGTDFSEPAARAVEWLWRSLTYGKAQPMRSAAPVETAA